MRSPNVQRELRSEMILLLITDTSAKNGSVALARATQGSKPERTAGDRIRCRWREALFRHNWSRKSQPCSKKHDFRKGDIDAFIVVSGPGSFTGLRVGLAAIKALAEILRKPIVPVSLLEVVALPRAGRGEL